MSGALIETSARRLKNEAENETKRTTALRMLKRGKLTTRAILRAVKQMLAVQLLVLRKMEDSMMDSDFAALQQLHSSFRVATYCRLSKDVFICCLYIERKMVKLIKMV